MHLFLKRSQPHELIAFEVRGRKPVVDHFAMQLLHTRSKRVLKVEVRQHRAQAVELHAIVARVLPNLARVDDLRHPP